MLCLGTFPEVCAGSRETKNRVEDSCDIAAICGAVYLCETGNGWSAPLQRNTTDLDFVRKQGSMASYRG